MSLICVLKDLTNFHCKRFQNYHSPEGLLMYVSEAQQNKSGHAWWRHQHFPRNWPFVRGIHRSQRRGALMFSLIYVWINHWVNNRETDDLRRYRAHYGVIAIFNHGELPVWWLINNVADRDKIQWCTEIGIPNPIILIEFYWMSASGCNAWWLENRRSLLVKRHWADPYIDGCPAKSTKRLGLTFITTRLNSVRLSDTYMRRYSSHHWFR